MTSTTDSNLSHLIRSSGWGVARGIFVHTLIYPLEVVKIRQQCSKNAEKSIQIASELFQKEGFGAFYSGLPPQLLKTSLKQVWCWPMITGVPDFLQRYGIGDIQRQILTGLSIATIDATITTPLERIKIISASTGKGSFSLLNAYKDGWRGYSTHLAKLSMNWGAFLTAQEYLRARSKSESDQPLTLPQLAKVGAQVALIVSLVGAPLDIANTLKQAKNLSPSSLLVGNRISKLYRGWPLNALSLVVHNVASVVVIDKLSEQNKT